jgi:hypothetical protein
LGLTANLLSLEIVVPASVAATAAPANKQLRMTGNRQPKTRMAGIDLVSTPAIFSKL